MTRAVALGLDITHIHKYDKICRKKNGNNKNDSSDENGEISGKSKVVSKKDGIYGVRFMCKYYQVKIA